MANIFNLQDLEDDFSEKINLDDLYEKKRESDLKQLEIFNKILSRAHNQIKIASRQNTQLQFCTFIVPEIMIGIPKYDSAMCIGYIISKLKDNGFNIKYIHPNMLFISWAHWVPSYVRKEIKNKTGKEVDSYGNFIDKNANKINKIKDDDDDGFDGILLNKKDNEQTQTANKKIYNSVKNYSPTGIYKNDIFDKINKNLKK